MADGFKKIIVAVEPVELEVPEGWDDEQIRTFLDNNSLTAERWQSWKHEDEWRN